MRKSQQQEYEAAGHIASVVRKPREMNAGAQLAVSVMLCPGPIFGTVLPTFKVDLPSSIKYFWKPCC